VTLEQDLPASLPEVRVDPMKLEQVFVELVSNALDAMPSGGRLAIAGRLEQSGETPGLAVTVQDTGSGIPDQVLPSIGEPFFTTRPEGTGLGVATARRFVEQHGGRLDLTSRVGEGTTVKIWLPQ
jgi:two-component system sensor histidine kinase AtoS